MLDHVLFMAHFIHTVYIYTYMVLLRQSEQPQHDVRHYIFIQ